MHDIEYYRERISELEARVEELEEERDGLQEQLKESDQEVKRLNDLIAEDRGYHRPQPAPDQASS